MDLMFQRAGRESLKQPAATAESGGARWARPGERPTPTRAPGERDDIIDRIDAYAAGMRRRGNAWPMPVN